MKVVIKDPKLKQAIQLVSQRAGNEKRVLSPIPDQEPYWHHLIRVYYWLLLEGESDRDILLAAILHDSVEDNHLTAQEIEELFGSRTKNIVLLLSETTHTDHTFSGNRDYYFENIENHPNEDIHRAAMKIKCADRYDNLIGISFTDLESKKLQFLNEIEKYLRGFSREVGLEDLLDKGIQVMRGEIDAPDIFLELNMESEIDFR